MTIAEINELIQSVDTNQVSDGHYTLKELYEHRAQLWIRACRFEVYLDNQLNDTPEVWRSKAHSDGRVWEGWFLLGSGKSKDEQITYHLPISKWNECNFAETLDRAPDWDGHTSNDVLKRL